jgi:hypothetical protein
MSPDAHEYRFRERPNRPPAPLFFRRAGENPIDHFIRRNPELLSESSGPMKASKRRRRVRGTLERGERLLLAARNSYVRPPADAPATPAPPQPPTS